ncbi:MAG: nucleotidyltransferase family protein [Comamonas sp.]
MPSESIVVIVLAGGRGDRFRASGGAVHKLDALLGGVPVLQHVLNTVWAAGLPVHLVRPDGGTLGMGDSIAMGVRAMAQATGWLMLPGDLPLVQPGSLRQVAGALASHPVAVPRWQRQSGHPVGFRAECRDALMALGGDAGAASIVRAWRAQQGVADVELDDPGIQMDIDTVDDLARAEEWLGKHPFR